MKTDIFHHCERGPSFPSYKLHNNLTKITRKKYGSHNKTYFIFDPLEEKCIQSSSSQNSESRGRQLLARLKATSPLHFLKDG